MSDLEDIESQLQNVINTLNIAIDEELRLHNAFDNLMKNAKAKDVTGIKRPNLYAYINMLKMQKESLETIKFHIECQIADNKYQS